MLSIALQCYSKLVIDEALLMQSMLQLEKWGPWCSLALLVCLSSVHGGALSERELENAPTRRAYVGGVPGDLYSQ